MSRCGLHTEGEGIVIDDLKKLVRGFPSTPFLFIGSGLTKRYFQLPSWKELLGVFARKIKGEDRYALAGYENKAREQGTSSNLLPAVATLIEADFNRKWFDEEHFRSIDPKYTAHVQDGASPFKAEIATYIQNRSTSLPAYENEILAFKNISKKNISGIITTNYDCFLEVTMDGYKPYIGQKGLIFSSSQGIAEIYKIHGCITQPDSIVITSRDYDEFKLKAQYLAAKLMTIFLEYPILFIGYSIGDDNIRTILGDIVKCLSSEDLNKLHDRFIFVEYVQGNHNVDITSHTIMIEDKTISMKKITLSDFGILYHALREKRLSIPVKHLRFLKQEFYKYTLTNEPTEYLHVTIDDDRIQDDMPALAIGLQSELLSEKGYGGITGDEWYRDIILGDLKANPGLLLQKTFPRLVKQNPKLPPYKYLSKAKGQFPDVREKAVKTFDDILSKSIIKDRDKIPCNRNIEDIWRQTKLPLWKRAELVARLREEEIDSNDLEKMLVELFTAKPDILSISTSTNTNEKTNLRRLIGILDYMKYGKK